MKIKKHAEIVETVRYVRRLTKKDGEVRYIFDIDKDGLVEQETEIQELLADNNTLVDQGSEEWIETHKEPAVGECSCGCEVELCNFTNECPHCGRQYDSSGMEL